MEFGNVYNILIPQFINQLTTQSVLVNFVRLVLARTFSAGSICFNASN